MTDADSPSEFPAPFASSLMHVEDAWIDYNDHLNMAYYNVLFDRAVDEAWTALGFGPEYLAGSGHTTFTAETHVRYLRELRVGDPVRVTLQLIAHDAKRLHYFEQLFHAEEGWLSATSENMTLHVDLNARKTAPFPKAVERRIAAAIKAHAKLPVPDGVGRSIGIPPKR